jgi:hypothetical protein
MAEQNPKVKILLERLGLNYLHELDPTKTYTLNLSTSGVKISNAAENAAATIGGLLGFASTVAKISSPGSDIQGLGRTVITCPLAPQTASVSGFMASTVSRDPIAGIRNGFLTQDNFLTTAADVNFSVLKATGGAKNPINRTAMETTHTGTCGDESIFQNLVSTWPPLRIDLVIDDTGSMSEELDGVKSALTSFIGSRNSDPSKPQKDVSYELISFKDSPTLVLGNTVDTNAAISAVNTLFADGGDDCPEDSIGGLNLALDRLRGDENSTGEIVLVTDASPGSGSVESVIARALGLGVKVNVML